MKKEYYNKTKSSNYHEAVKYRKPLITPSYLKIPESIKSSTITYQDTDELSNQLQKMITSKKDMENIKKQAVKNTEIYTCKNMMQYLHTNVL
jgi:hypothetical protein